MKIKKLLGYKTLGAQTQQLLQEKYELGQIVSSHNMHVTTSATTFASSEMALKIIIVYV